MIKKYGQTKINAPAWKLPKVSLPVYCAYGLARGPEWIAHGTIDYRYEDRTINHRRVVFSFRKKVKP